MLITNEYFEGKVKSITLKTNMGPATVGVMEVGEYEFATTSKEEMIITSGRLNVKLPENKEFEIFLKDDSFHIPENSKFSVIAEEETAYICYYN